MKLARSLIGVVVANPPFAAEYFHNLSPPPQGATVSPRPDRPAQFVWFANDSGRIKKLHFLCYTGSAARVNSLMTHEPELKTKPKSPAGNRLALRSSKESSTAVSVLPVKQRTDGWSPRVKRMQTNKNQNEPVRFAARRRSTGMKAPGWADQTKRPMKTNIQPQPLFFNDLNYNGGTASRSSDWLLPAIAGGPENTFSFLRCVLSVFRLPSIERASVA